MAKYHINPKTGNPGKCNATVSCPFGGIQDHYDSRESARNAYEASMDKAAAVNKAVAHRIHMETLVAPVPHLHPESAQEIRDNVVHLQSQLINDETWSYVKAVACMGVVNQYYNDAGGKKARGPEATVKFLKRLEITMDYEEEYFKKEAEDERLAQAAPASAQDGLEAARIASNKALKASYLKAIAEV